MSPFFCLARTRSFCLLHPLFRIDTEDQPHRHLVAICQLQNYARDLPRIAFQTPFESSQYLQERTDRGLILRQQVRSILNGAPYPVGPNTSRLECADLDSEGRNFHRQRVAETAHRPLGRVIRRIARNRVTATDRRHLKDVTALLLTHHGHSGARGVHHAVKACVHDRLEVVRTHLLERCKLSIACVIHQNVQPPECIHCQLHGSFCGGFVPHFHVQGLPPLAISRHQRSQFFRPARPSDHAVTCGQPPLRDVPPQPVSASRNQPDLRHEDPPFSFLDRSMGALTRPARLSSESIVSTYSFMRCNDSPLPRSRR